MPDLTPEELSAAESGITAAAAEGKSPEDAQAEKDERAQVAYWLNEIKVSRNFDREVYGQMAVSRGYAQGLSAHEVSVNLIGSAIDVMKAFLYAKNPDIAVTPARQTSLPTLERPIMPIEPVNPLPQLQAMISQVGGGEGVDAAAVGASPEVMMAAMPVKQKYDQDMAIYQAELAAYKQAMRAYIGEMKARQQARETRKRFSETMEILISKSWNLGELKEEARSSVGGTLTTSIGWLKATWQEDSGMDPLAIKRLNSLQENIGTIDMLKLEAADKPTENLDRLRQDITERITAVNAAKEVVTARGLVIDNLAAEDITIPIGVTKVVKTSSLPWLGHRVFMEVRKAKAMFPDVAKWEQPGAKVDCWASATRYSQRKPVVRVVVPEGEHPGVLVSSASDASQFTTGGDGKTNEMVADGTGDFLCFHEIWDKDAGLVRLVCEGLPRYPRQPHAPEVAVTRFFPFYAQAYVEADGMRYPQSLVQRSYQLQDEYNARRSSYKKQRTRNKQGIIADGTKLDKDEMGKLKMSTEGEITVIETAGQDIPIQNAFMAKPTVQLDPMLYEVDSIRRDFEEMWGIQQALQGGISVEKTATEADIQQQGFSAKTAFMREPLEVMLNDLAQATAEMLLQRLTLADAQEYAGPGAVWPEAASVSDLASMVSVSIKAGSTGKPNTASERNAWAQTYPMVTEAIKEIGALRQAPPTEIADKLERLVEITLQLAGSSIDKGEIVPQESMPTPQPQEGSPGAPAEPMPSMPSPDGPPMPAGPAGPGPV